MTKHVIPLVINDQIAVTARLMRGGKDNPLTPTNPILAGLLCRCPVCGKGPLFEGFLKVRKACRACSADLSKAESGDGPVVFILLIVGAIGCAGLLFTELNARLPVALVLAIWIPITVGLSLGVMRPFKALMIAAQFHFKASESVHKSEPDDAQ